MSDYFPAPPAPGVTTRILGPDGVPLTGDVKILSGQNQSVTRSGNGLILAASAPANARELCAFSPGVLAARTLQNNVVDGAILQNLDVFCLTAPAGVTGASC